MRVGRSGCAARWRRLGINNVQETMNIIERRVNNMKDSLHKVQRPLNNLHLADRLFSGGCGFPPTAVNNVQTGLNIMQAALNKVERADNIIQPAMNIVQIRPPTRRARHARAGRAHNPGAGAGAGSSGQRSREIANGPLTSMSGGRT